MANLPGTPEAWEYLLMVMAKAQESKSNRTGTFQAFGRGMPVNISLAKTNHLAKPKVKREIYPASYERGTSRSCGKGHGFREG